MSYMLQVEYAALGMLPLNVFLIFIHEKTHHLQHALCTGASGVLTRGENVSYRFGDINGRGRAILRFDEVRVKAENSHKRNKPLIHMLLTRICVYESFCREGKRDC